MVVIKKMITLTLGSAVGLLPQSQSFPIAHNPMAKHQVLHAPMREVGSASRALLLSWTPAAQPERHHEVSSEPIIANHMTQGVQQLDALVALLKSKIQHLTDEHVQRLLRGHLENMHLLDGQGQWASKKLEAIAETLLPSGDVKKMLEDLLDHMASANKANPDFIRVMAEMSRNQACLHRLKEVFAKEADRVIPEVITFALVLENLTAAQTDNPDIIETVFDIWHQARQHREIKIESLADVFGLIKLHSVEAPIKKIIAYHKQPDALDPKLFRGFLSLNIFEAMVADLLMGHTDNAKAGFSLLKNPPGGKAHRALGTGPSTFSNSGKELEFRMSCPKKWADNYQAWNLGFLSQIEVFPFWFVKLLIPSVADYKDHPEIYIYRRALSLYTSLNYSAFMSDKPEGMFAVDWRDEAFTHLFGAVNKLSSEGYEQSVRDAKLTSDPDNTMWV